jgi:hypothetical protein
MARARITSRRAPSKQAVVGDGADEVVGIGEHRAVQGKPTDRGDVGDEVEHARDHRGSSRRGQRSPRLTPAPTTARARRRN